MESKQSVVTFYFQYLRKKKQDIIFGSVVTSLLIFLVKTQTQYIQNDLITELKENTIRDTEGKRSFKST